MTNLHHQGYYGWSYFEEAPEEIVGGCGSYKAIEILNEIYGDKVVCLIGPRRAPPPAACISFKDPESNIRSARSWRTRSSTGIKEN